MILLDYYLFYFVLIDNKLFFTTTISLGKGRGQHAAIRLMVQVQVQAMPKNLRCDWSTRFMRVISLGLSLVGTNLQYRRTETGLQY